MWRSPRCRAASPPSRAASTPAWPPCWASWPGTVLYCTVLHCTVLYCTVLYCAGQAAAQQGVQQPVDPPPGTMLLLLQCTGRGYSYPSVFTITENAPTRAFSWLKVPTSTFTIKKDTIKTLGETGVNPQ